jgi:hypothetical protein
MSEWVSALMLVAGELILQAPAEHRGRVVEEMQDLLLRASNGTIGGYTLAGK